MTSDRWQRIEELYHSAREREGSQRAAFLKEACAGDDALRREVESLLAREKGVEGFLEAPALAEAAKLLVEDRGQSWVGRQIGSYQVLSFLDAGGMGEVYRARDTKLGLTTPTGRAMAGLLAVFAEFEREVLRERVRAGIAQARERGKRRGRSRSAAQKAGEVKQLFSEGLSKTEIAHRLNIG